MKIVDLIPQVFYDAIARVVPGLVLLISFAIMFAEPLNGIWIQYKDILLQTPATLSLGSMIIAYALSMVVEGIQNDTKKIIKKLDELQKRPSGSELRKEEWDDAWEDFYRAHPSREGMEPPQPSDAVAIDAIRLVNPVVGARVVKLRAEVKLCKTLYAGWMVLFVLYSIFIIWALLSKQQLSLQTVILTFASLLIGIRAISSRHVSIDRRHVRALYNHWLLLVTPGPPNETEKRLEYIGGNAKQPSFFIIRLKALKNDVQIMGEKKGSKKLLVTEVWDEIEERATNCKWRPPGEKDKSQVLQTDDIELGIFTHHAPQDRHFHKLGTEIYSVLEGQMDIEIDEDSHTLEQGDTIVVLPGATHKVLKNKSFLCQVVSANSHGKPDKYVVEEKSDRQER